MKFKIPNRFDLVNETIRVKRWKRARLITQKVDGKDKRFFLYGLAKFQPLIMNLAKKGHDGKSIPKDVLYQSFLHEMVHFILNSMENDLTYDEPFVDKFASLLCQALKSMR